MSVVLMAVVVVAASLALGLGLDSTSPKITTTLQVSCPPGTSYMGCSQPQNPKLTQPFTPKGQLVPDVSDNNGLVNWTLVKRWEVQHGWKTQGGIFKLGEYSLDSFAVSNSTQLHKLGMVAVGYDFVRPSVSPSTVVSWARRTGVRAVVLDEEVPGIQGSASRLIPALKAAGIQAVIDYHSADNVFDSSARGLPCWVAAYQSIEPSCSTGKIVAWQYTDRGSIPGVNGHVDLSVSYGLLQLGLAPKPVVTYKTPILVSRQRNVVLTISCAKAPCRGVEKVVAEVGLGKNDPVVSRFSYSINPGRSAHPSFVLSKTVYAIVKRHRVDVKVSGTTSGTIVLVKE